MAGNKQTEDRSNRTLKRLDIAQAVNLETGLSSKDSKHLVSQLFDHISDALSRGETVKLAGFGTFNLRQKVARLGRNPKTGEECIIEPRKVIVFKPSSFMKERLAQGLETENQSLKPTPDLSPKRRTQALSHQEWTSLFEIFGIFVFLNPQYNPKKFEAALDAIAELKSIIEPKAPVTKRTILSWFTLNKGRFESVAKSETKQARFETLLDRLQHVEQKRDIIFSMLGVSLADGEYSEDDRALIIQAILKWDMSAGVFETLEQKHPNIAQDLRATLNHHLGTKSKVKV